jgi:hypothetical protein
MNIARFRPFAALAAAVALAAFTGCETTTLQNAWKAPEVGSIKFTKVLVIGICPVDSLRQPVEDAMKGQITAVPSVASYTLLPDVKDQVDPKKIAEVIKAGGFDGIVTMRMIALQDEQTFHEGGYVPTGYQTFSSYYSPGYALSPYYRHYPGAYGAGYGGYGMPMEYEYVPPSITTDQIMSIETNIYDATTGKLIWTGLTRTKNADERHNTIAEVAAVVKAKLQSQRLIK